MPVPEPARPALGLEPPSLSLPASPFTPAPARPADAGANATSRPPQQPYPGTLGLTQACQRDRRGVSILQHRSLMIAACPNCLPSQRAWQLVVSDAGGVHAAMLLAPLLIVGALAVSAEGGPRGGYRKLVGAGLLLGAGLGGFVDGIVLHQILQWHNLLSSVRPPTDLVSMKYNMVWDGLFHAFTWLMVLAGLWRSWVAGAAPRHSGSGHALVASMFVGWGLFNVIEGSIDHQLLGIHHVHPGTDQLAWDLGFLAFGAVLVAGGAVWLRGLGRAHHAEGDR